MNECTCRNDGRLYEYCEVHGRGRGVAGAEFVIVLMVMIVVAGLIANIWRL